VDVNDECDKLSKEIDRTAQKIEKLKWKFKFDSLKK